MILISVCAKDKYAAWPELNSVIQNDPKLEADIAVILKSMTLKEKIGQMVQAEIKSVSPADVKEYRLGSILNGGGSFPNNNKYSKISDWVSLADLYYFASMDTTDGRKAIPIIWGTDAVHGHNNVVGATIFPHNIGLGASNDPELIEKIGRATAKEVLATGIDWVFAPTVAVVRNDQWGRTYESYSENPEIIKKYAKSMVSGLQGKSENIFGEDHLIATVKHFIGDGGTKDGVDQGDNVDNEQDLINIHAQGYFSGLNAGAQTVMASFNSWNGDKIHGNKYLLTDVLKNKMRFDGFVIGDWNGHGQVEGCSNNSCAKAINAGVDMLMAPEDWKELIKNTIDQVNSGKISMARIDDAVTRILRVKIRAGLLKSGAPSSRKYANDEKVIGSQEHRDLARRAVRESLVLLKNKNNILPISAKSNILVAGKAANDISQQSGGWSITWQGTGNNNSDFPGGTTIYDGISRAVKMAGGNISFSAYGDFKRKPDVAIVVFGETPYAEGQGDRQNLYYNETFPEDLALLNKLKRQGIPVVSVFLTGRPLWINPELNASEAFVVAWLPGSEGVGVSDVLIGNAFDFKGKLSFSWPSNASQAVLNVDTKNYKPLFPFGFGLTYKDIDVLGDKLPEIPFPEGQNPNPSKTVNVFSGRSIAPFKTYVGDHVNWKHELSGDLGLSLGGVVSVVAVDKDVQEDARQITFNGANKGNFYFQSKSKMNIHHYLDSKGVLKMDLRVDRKPSENVDLLMGLAQLNITTFLNALNTKEWKSLKIGMNCFDNLGADFMNLDMPFSIATNGSLKVSVANISIAAELTDKADIDCE
jgi:beta-glucosidase